MGYIYELTNLNNGQKYIGQTTLTIDERMKYHKKAYQNVNDRLYLCKLYVAFRKYGFDTFQVRMIEECDNEKLNEREQYYIQKYNTVIDGYNETLGGAGKPLWNSEQIRAWKVLYDNGWLLKEIADVFHVGKHTVGNKLREIYKIDTRHNNNKRNANVIICENGMKFIGLSEAADYVMKNNLCKSKNKNCVQSKISNAIHNQVKAYGLAWNFD